MDSEGFFCEGACLEHAGTIKLVHVKDKRGYDWGTWYYCDVAQKTDEKAGLLVELGSDDGDMTQ